MKDKLLILFFAFILFEIPFGMDISLAPGLSLKNFFLYILLVAIFLGMAVRAREFRISPASIHASFVGVILVSGVSWIISAVVYEQIDYPVFSSFVELKSTSVDHYLIMFVYAYALISRREVLSCAQALVAIVVFSSFFTFLELTDVLTLGAIEERADGRVQGPIGQANQYGGFLCFWIPICISAYLACRNWWRPVLGLGALLSVGLLALTGSRGALVGAVAGSLFAVVILRKHLPGRIVLKGSMATLAVVIGVLLVISSQFTEVIESRIERTTSGDTRQVTAGRAEIWNSAIMTMAEKPASFLYGNGWMSFRLLFDKSAHNMYLEKLFELGFIGLSAYLALLAFVILHMRAALDVAKAESRTYIVGCIFALCSVSVSTFFSELYRPWMLIWAYLGLMLRLAMLEREFAPRIGKSRIHSQIRASVSTSERLSKSMS